MAEQANAGAKAPNGAGRPSKAELDKRQTELDKRTEALDRREAALAARTAELDDREAGLPPAQTDARELAELNAHAADRGYVLTPEPAAGMGFVVIETPLDLVAVFASLHPSDHVVISAQIAGAMRQTLTETGRLGRGMRRAEPEPAAVAVLVGSGEPA